LDTLLEHHRASPTGPPCSGSEGSSLSRRIRLLHQVGVSGTAGYERFLREKRYTIPGMSHTRSRFTLPVSNGRFSVQLAGQALKDYTSRKSEY